MGARIASTGNGIDIPAGGFNNAGDQICASITGEWHDTIDKSTYDPNLVCEMFAATMGRTCKAYCADFGRDCLHGQDNEGICGVGGDHTRQSTDENGCLQEWQGQICGRA